MAGATHYSQLVCWQLADAVRVQTFGLTRRVSFAHDRRHREQTEDAADSVCRNIAEGFGCASHVEFARYLEISRRSLNELTDGLRSAQLKGYVVPDDIQSIQTIARRLYPALAGLMRYLRNTPPKRRR